ncbi:hypothetical protein RCL1_002101 [Eukaryota sp. TZLM3-RCL]
MPTFTLKPSSTKSTNLYDCSDLFPEETSTTSAVRTSYSSHKFLEQIQARANPDEYEADFLDDSDIPYKQMIFRQYAPWTRRPISQPPPTKDEILVDDIDDLEDGSSFPSFTDSDTSDMDPDPTNDSFTSPPPRRTRNSIPKVKSTSSSKEVSPSKSLLDLLGNSYRNATKLEQKFAQKCNSFLEQNPDSSTTNSTSFLTSEQFLPILQFFYDNFSDSSLSPFTTQVLGNFSKFLKVKQRQFLTDFLAATDNLLLSDVSAALESKKEAAVTRARELPSMAFLSDPHFIILVKELSELQFDFIASSNDLRRKKKRKKLSSDQIARLNKELFYSLCQRLPVDPGISLDFICTKLQELIKLDVVNPIEPPVKQPRIEHEDQDVVEVIEDDDFIDLEGD